MVERFPSLEAAEVFLRSPERRLGRKAKAIATIEAGGVNGTLPLAIGARVGLPVVNADGMGRAFPELQMVTFGIYGHAAGPLSLASEHKDAVTIDVCSNSFADILARDAVVAMGSLAQISLYPLLAKDLRQCAVPRTISLSVDIGRVISRPRTCKKDTFALIDFFHNSQPSRLAKMMLDAKVVDVVRETKVGFAHGHVEPATLDDTRGLQSIRFQNKYLALEEDGRSSAMVPDLIALLDRDTGEPITTETGRYGQRVKAVAVSAPENVWPAPSARGF